MKGRRLSKTMGDLTVGSEEMDLCPACELDGEYRHVVKFCLDCNQSICQSCVDSHRRIKQIQIHKLVDNKKEEAVKIAKTLSASMTCPNHAGKTVEFICFEHDAFCCSTCATVSHRRCQEVEEIAALGHMSSDFSTTMKTVSDTRDYIKGILELHQKNNKVVQKKIRRIIPKQIREMKASLINAFDKIETNLLKETERIGTSINKKNESKITKWQSLLTTLDKEADSLSVAKGHGSDVHKYIAAKNAEKKLSDVHNSIFQGRNVHINSLSFSFDKFTFLQNAYVGINDDAEDCEIYEEDEFVEKLMPQKRFQQLSIQGEQQGLLTKSLAEIVGEGHNAEKDEQTALQPLRYGQGQTWQYNRDRQYNRDLWQYQQGQNTTSTPFASLSAEILPIEAPAYPNYQPSTNWQCNSRNSHNSRGWAVVEESCY